MRVRYTYNHIINHLPEWMLVFAIVFSTLSCTDDYGNAPVATSDEATVILTIKTSKSDVSRAATRVQTDNEAYISNVNVLVFNDALSNGNYSFSYRASGTHIDFRMTRPHSFKPLCIVLKHP